MSCVWQESRPGEWTLHVLADGKLLVGEELGVAGIGLLRLKRGGALFVRPGVRVRVNGEPVLGGLRLLEHADEILAAGVRLCFSQETTPVVVRFAPSAGQRLPVCPVCRGPVREGVQAVQCPGCGRWHHQQDAEGDRPAKRCWSYAQACRFCNHPTSFQAEAAWRPEREESRV